MKKKMIIGFVISIIVVLITVIAFLMINNNNLVDNNNLSDESKNIDSNIDNSTVGIVDDESLSNANNNTLSNNISTGSKILVVYYSAQNHTKAVSEKIANNLNADIFEIVPKQIYTSDDLSWNNGNSRVSKEHNDESLRNVELVTTNVEGWNDYDTVLIGYPIWWGISAWPVNTFVKANDFSDKTIIPFCTSASSDLGQSGKLLEKEANSGKWLEGHRFSSNPTDNDIKKWTDRLK